ncbi:aldehyde reductase ii [Stemphylium lycopersici]|nr:aldehyde reductase ii [Stemphylium lycopersici]
MPTLALDTGATVFVTGVNGLVGSHVADQLLKRGYNVRGAVRDTEKHKYLTEYFFGKHKFAKFELVGVPDMTVEGCYDGVVEGIGGFVHVASPVGGISDVDLAISIAVNGALNALKACAKTSSCRRFVFTSSSIAATFPHPNVECSVDENTYNDKALEILRKEPGKPGLFVYAAMKTETEKAMWTWVKENQPGFVLNTVLPNANFGAVLIPEHQGFPSTIEWAHDAWLGKELEMWKTFAGPQWYVHPVDCALVHVSALVHSEVDSERLFAFAEPWSYNQMMDTWRKLYPERKFVENIEGLGVDKMRVPNKRAEEVLMWVKGAGWDSMEKGMKEMTENWI